MATFVRGKQGLVEDLIEQRRRLETSLVSDERTLVNHRMGKRRRENIQTQIETYNWIVAWINSVNVVDPAEFDRRFGAPAPTPVTMVGSTADYYESTQLDDVPSGYVAAAILSDGTHSWPMGATTHRTRALALADCERIEWTSTGPVLRNPMDDKP